MLTFDQFGLADPILRAVAAEGYTTPTPIQEATIRSVLDGRDVLGCAQTGTGKTAAFALPLLHRLNEAGPPRTGKNGKRTPRCLVLSPTRELASQIMDSFKTYGRNLKLRATVVFGGVGQNPQVDALRRGVDILVATPGRLLDLCNQGHIDLSRVNSFVLDEADRMLDMGFIHDIKRVIKMLPDRKQTLLFSATIPPEIDQLAKSLLNDPVTVRLAPQKPTAEGIKQAVYFVTRAKKTELLAKLVDYHGIDRAIVFTRTRYGAEKVVRQLRKAGVQGEAIHGDKSQNARTRALNNFKSGRTPLLIATDVASRGIDVDGVSHVINYDIARDPESHVHRIGRTARAGATGVALSFCDTEEVTHLAAIQKFIRMEIPVGSDHWNLTFPTPEIKTGGGGDNGNGRGRSGGQKKQGRSAGRKPRGKSHPMASKGNAKKKDGRAKPARDGGNTGAPSKKRRRRRRRPSNS